MPSSLELIESRRAVALISPFLRTPLAVGEDEHRQKMTKLRPANELDTNVYIGIQFVKTTKKRPCHHWARTP
jgi:hypothetical protein